MAYVIGKTKPGKAACRVETLQGVPDTFELHQGKSRAVGWPSDAHYKMNPNFPDKVGLEDFVQNQGGLLVASERVRELLEAEKVKNLEFLPVAIMNHKGRIEKAPYFVVNTLVLQDCLDLRRTVHTKNQINPEVFFSISNITFDEGRIDPAVSLFRVRHYPFIEIFREDLVNKVKGAGFTGIRFMDLKEFSD